MVRRRGIIIKNVSERPLEIALSTRTLRLAPGDERPVTPKEVRDAGLKDPLQLRTIAIVRPTTEEEEKDIPTDSDADESEDA